MTTEEKFNAAVNVIRSLPKNGSYQPSNDLMLRFYSYFKQATQGPCTGSRPGFWDLVGRAKYDAWKSLGDMPKTQAMKKYVDELHSIIETMSYSDKVASFLEEAPQNEIDNFPMDELQLIAGDVIDKVRSDPNSPFNSRGPSPVNLNSYENSLSSTSINLDESSDDEYIDTIEAEDPKAIHKIVARNVGNKSKSKHTQSSSVDISQELNKVVQSLQADIQRLTEKINKIEAKKRTVDTPKTLSTPLLAFLIIWPFVCTLVFNGLRRNKA